MLWFLVHGYKQIFQVCYHKFTGLQEVGHEILGYQNIVFFYFKGGSQVCILNIFLA